MSDPDPEEENEEEEEEEEEDLVDPMDAIRESCEEKPECSKLKLELSNCEERVNSKSSTTETCAQELLDFMHCRDHCVSKSLFNKLK
ncbi:cytochrome b-c1 complex subunit 6, mitochondrial isoform X2 [Nematostella vectensis]|nr:cytochrome b-c1 complex subunit 6, mitochondrial isoform X2 [Nematostella vectensis]